MELFFLIVVSLIIVFGLAILFGAPYLPVLKMQMITSLDLLELKPGQKIVDLGSGDGRFLLMAAKKGLIATGYEINPILVLISKLRTRKYRSQVTVLWKNYWKEDWSETDAFFVFLISKYMKKLNNKIIQYNHKPVKLASVGYKIPGVTSDKHKNGVFLYKYN